MQRLNNKTAVITGGVQGIGLNTAELFASEGARVIIWDMNAEKGEAIVEKLNKNGASVTFMTVNVSRPEDVNAAAVRTAEHFDCIDILVNNAGITRDARLINMSPEDWQQVIDVNLTGVFNCCKAVAPFMIEKQAGRIINTSSIVGLYGNFGQSNYVATKAGVIGMTKVLARELGRKGITVNAVAPGFIATDMIETVPEAVLNSLQEKTPLNRLGTPRDIANAYLFLAGDEAAFVNGAVLSVDGGLTI